MESLAIQGTPTLSRATPYICTDMSKADYLALDAVSNSMLNHLWNASPAHLRYALDNPPKQTPALALGEAIHTAILEPERFLNLYVQAPKVDHRTKSGKAEWESFLEENAGKAFLSASDYKTCEEIQASFRAHAPARTFVEEAKYIESSILWHDVSLSIDRKGRPDILDSLGCIVDIKTTDDAIDTAFERSILKYGYHRAAAGYLDGAKACGFDVNDYILIAIEKSPPYGIKIYRLRDDVIAQGREENARLLTLYAECKHSNHWPSYPQEIEEIGLPAWAMNGGSTNGH